MKPKIPEHWHIYTFADRYQDLVASQEHTLRFITASTEEEKAYHGEWAAYHLKRTVQGWDPDWNAEALLECARKAGINV